LLEAVHRDLFLPNFPDPDEQEGPDDWRPRLWEDPAPRQPEQHGFVAGTHLGSAAQRSLAGFAFVERYRESRCALLSYIAVEKSWRGYGLARDLFDRALGSAQETAQKDGEPVRAVFAEIHDPRRVNEANDVIDPADRVQVMVRLGAWRVPISYIQPALDERSERSDRLMLIAFALDGKPTVDADAVAKFLSEYFRSLGIEDPASDPDLMNVMNELEELGPGPVDLVPLAPSLEFERFSVVLHFVGRVAEADPAKTARRWWRWPRKAAENEEKDAPNTPDEPPENPFASFEEDLLSYRYLSRRRRTAPPECESNVVEFEGDHGQKVAVALSMPVPIPYHSEGLKSELHFPPPYSHDRRRRTLTVRASRTYFPKSRYSVFHLALVPSGCVLDEYDLVALSKLWQSGEVWEAAEEICLDGTTVGGFALEVFKGYPELKDPDARVRAGTIQLITDDAPRGVTWTTIWDSVKALVADEDGNNEKISEEIAQATAVGKQVKALGGIVQGILDFQAIDATELADVFGALEIDATSLMGIHKGTLLCVMESDRSYDTAAQRIGASPYLLLPQAVLLHNEALLDQVASHAESVEETKDRVELAECFKKMRNMLACYVPNVFHYPQERRLFEDGEKTRGLSERRTELVDKAEEIETRWKVAVEDRRSSAETLRNVLLALIGLSTFPYVHGVGLFVGLFGLAVALVILSLHSNPRWSWSSPRSWSSVVGDVLKRRKGT
jgi:GNAT superfamily N-acetyltransferase